MGILKSLFGKKEGNCCNVKIEEVKETKDACCSAAEPVKKKAGQSSDSCCK
ncbi:hypothetical protein G3578_12095 [Brevibacillus sp. SYP-B805]|uniref:hypothetical protein n=1 Tax=Brevibacillus sp. SYP-B805 TaxID=1578199 RepID=UPI0013EA06BF|nr:hypothetical protein [Brevibacillus sp. SYP-B805]NGQ95897.1 hypothetical protein [Brevibacillus sp. SYP-B805]